MSVILESYLWRLSLVVIFRKISLVV